MYKIILAAIVSILLLTGCTNTYTNNVLNKAEAVEVKMKLVSVNNICVPVLEEWILKLEKLNEKEDVKEGDFMWGFRQIHIDEFKRAIKHLQELSDQFREITKKEFKRPLRITRF